MHALLERRDCDNVCNRCASRHFIRYLHDGLGDRLRLHESLHRYRDDGTCNMLIDIGDVSDIGRDVGCVIDLGNNCWGDYRITAIDVGEIRAADGVRRLIDLARRQWKPTDVWRCTSADGNRYLEIFSAYECDQRWCVHRLLALWSRNPAPGTTDVRPAAVMRHGEAPRRIIYPGPAPRINPGPMAIAVRSPIGCHMGRRPDVAVVGIGTPGAVGIEVFVTHHFGRHVTRGRRIIAATITFSSPAIQIVFTPRPETIIVGQVGAVEAISLMRIDRIRCAVAVHFTLATLHHHCRCIVIRVDINTIFAGAAQSKCQIGCVDFKGLVRPHMAYPHFQRTLRKLQLRYAVVEIEHGHTGGGAEAQRSAADL